jgi:cellulose synthase/poly-beta-1,6-N-acetylglucosamine synthase-like glycosyltransferase
MQVLIFPLSMALTLLFFLYGFNHYYLLSTIRKYKKPLLPESSAPRPKISIHLPIYNERYVVRRLIAACIAMAESYGLDKVNIKVLDDSTDDTSLAIQKILAEYREKNVNIEVLCRDCRTGFKAGALQAAVEKTEEDFIAIFDADFLPPPDFLLRTLPYFMQDERVGIVQSRWIHINRDYNFLTRAIALGIDVHYLVEQTGRFAAGCFQNFNGSGGVLRKSAILEAGGWQADTLAEDLDISYRMQNLGYKILFLKDLLSPGEIPPTVPSFKKQQARWACGSLRTARKMLPGIFQNKKLSLKLRLQAFIHLTGYILHPMMLLSFLLICLVTLFEVNNALFSSPFPGPLPGSLPQFPAFFAGEILKYPGWDLLMAAIVICTAAPWISMIVALKLQNLSVSRNLISLGVTFLLGFGISLSNTIEAGKALLSNRTWDFNRTPKYASLQKDRDWMKKQYQIPLDFTWALELLLVCLGGVSIGVAIWNANYGALAILIPYTSAYLFVSSLTVFQSRNEKAV